MYWVCAAVFTATLIGLVLGYRRLDERAALERAEEILAAEIEALEPSAEVSTPCKALPGNRRGPPA